jgi:hypothetical protein
VSAKQENNSEKYNKIQEMKTSIVKSILKRKILKWRVLDKRSIIGKKRFDKIKKKVLRRKTRAPMKVK